MEHIKLTGVSKYFVKDQYILRDIDLTINQGEFFVLVGPSGSGKSTLLRMIAGLEDTSSGIIEINGKIVNDLPPKDRNLSMVFQNYALYPHLTAEHNILFGLQARKVPKAEQQKRLKEAAEMVGLSDLLKRKPGQMSGGQRQRVALARAIVSEAPLCLMDEPLSNLDAKLRAQMRAEISHLQKSLGLTTIYVTHDQVEAMTMGDRIVVLDDGITQQIGAPLELYNQPQNLFVATFIGTPKMNLAKAEIIDSKLVIDNFVHISISQNTLPFEQLSNLVVGIRSEHILYENSTERTCNLKVINVEQLGNETLISFDLAGDSWNVKWPGQWRIDVGEMLPIRIPIESISFFDSISGRLIHGATAANQKR